MKFFSITYSLLHHLYVPYDLFFNESVFITINNFLLLTVVNILTILHAGSKIAAWIDKWAIVVSVDEQIIQPMMNSITWWILQQFSWMLQCINECCNKLVLLWYILFYQLFLSLHGGQKKAPYFVFDLSFSQRRFFENFFFSK